jgi:hypothetical protein
LAQAKPANGKFGESPWMPEIEGQQERLGREVFAKSKGLKTRLAAAIHSKFTPAKDDRKLLGVVFRYTEDPEHPLGEGWLTKCERN